MRRSLLFTGFGFFVLTASMASAAATSIAVMPFRDLSGANTPVGDGIRESVTSDLRGIPGVRVVERSEIDRVISEQKLQAVNIDGDPLATMRIGKLVGADVMTVGAYQRVGRRIRLTARFVKVETGEVIGSAKVDGKQSDFLSLQDQVTVELLKSAKLAPQVVERLARRSRPKLRSLRAVELYGRASKVKDDEPLRRAILREAVTEEPKFSYAADALAELEKRLEEFERKRRELEEVQLRAARQRLQEATTPQERCQHTEALTHMLQARRFFHEDARNWKKCLDGLEPSADPTVQPARVRAEGFLILALSRLRDDEAVLKRGDTYLAEHPESPLGPAVKRLLEDIIERRRKIDGGRARALEELAKMRAEDRWDLCAVAKKFKQEGQLAEAQRLYTACVETDSGDPNEGLLQLADIAFERRDWKTARHYLSVLEKQSPEFHFANRYRVELRMPADD